LLSKAGVNENDRAQNAGFDSFAAPTNGIAEVNPSQACFQKRLEAK